MTLPKRRRRPGHAHIDLMAELSFQNHVQTYRHPSINMYISIFIFMCMYICIYVHMCICKYVYIYICLLVSIWGCLKTGVPRSAPSSRFLVCKTKLWGTPILRHPHTCICFTICTYMYNYWYIHMCVYVCVCVCLGLIQYLCS